MLPSAFNTRVPATNSVMLSREADVNHLWLSICLKITPWFSPRHQVSYVVTLIRPTSRKHNIIQKSECHFSIIGLLWCNYFFYTMSVFRSRSKERRPSLIKKLVRRSRSLPRNIGREKSRELLVAPDYYDINPQHTLIVSQNGGWFSDVNYVFISSLANLMHFNPCQYEVLSPQLIYNYFSYCTLPYI